MTRDASGPWCSCTGCSQPATARIYHPRRGSMVVCETHTRDYLVEERLRDEDEVGV